MRRPGSALVDGIGGQAMRSRELQGGLPVVQRNELSQFLARALLLQHLQLPARRARISRRGGRRQHKQPCWSALSPWKQCSPYRFFVGL